MNVYLHFLWLSAINTNLRLCDSQLIINEFDLLKSVSSEDHKVICIINEVSGLSPFGHPNPAYIWHLQLHHWVCYVIRRLCKCFRLSTPIVNVYGMQYKQIGGEMQIKPLWPQFWVDLT